MLCLSECGNVDFVQSSQGEVAVVIFEHISEFSLLVTTLVFMTSHLQFLAGKNPKPTRIIYAVVAVIMLAYIALDCYNFANNYDAASDGLYRADSRIGTAYYAIYLVISIVAVITMIISLVQMNSRHV